MAIAMNHSVPRTAPPRTASLLTSWYSRRPKPVIRATLMYGITVICNSLMKAIPTCSSGATSSPKNKPTAIPRNNASRIRPPSDRRGSLGGAFSLVVSELTEIDYRGLFLSCVLVAWLCLYHFLPKISIARKISEPAKADTMS